MGRADRVILLDAHCDAPSQMLRLRDFALDNDHAQVDFPKMRRGGVNASFFALYVPAGLRGSDATDYARLLLRETQRQVLRNEDTVAFAFSAADVRRLKAEGRIAILLAIENSSALNGDLRLLEEFYRAGVRYITLTHSEDNGAGDSCTGSVRWGGLSPFGRELVREMNRMGMLVDVSHAADSTICDVLSITDRPVVDTHCCCRALCGHRRNLSDELLRGIAESGGVVGMSVYPSFLSDDFGRVLADSGLESQMWVEDEFIADPGNPAKRRAWNELQDKLSALARPGISTVIEHIRHAVSVAGAEHVGIGTDFDGIAVTPSGLETIEAFGRLCNCEAACLDENTHAPHVRKGQNRRTDIFIETPNIGNIAGENFLRLL